jgi:hypothetical protein
MLLREIETRVVPHEPDSPSWSDLVGGSVARGRSLGHDVVVTLHFTAIPGEDTDFQPTPEQVIRLIRESSLPVDLTGSSSPSRVAFSVQLLTPESGPPHSSVIESGQAVQTTVACRAIEPESGKLVLLHLPLEFRAEAI